MGWYSVATTASPMYAICVTHPRNNICVACPVYVICVASWPARDGAKRCVLACCRRTRGACCDGWCASHCSGRR
eukprot:766114-Hanusia_phi.AAC.1